MENQQRTTTSSPDIIASQNRNSDPARNDLAQQPWRAIWPMNKPDASAHKHSVLYGYQKGAIMMTQGSAGEANMSILYDTGDPKKEG